MGDEGFDPCECIFNHEMAMRRLLSLLRNSQSYCDDNECMQDGLPGPNNPNGANDNSSFIMMTMAWMMLALIMYFLRPNSLRNDPAEKQRPNNNNDRRDPPAIS